MKLQNPTKYFFKQADQLQSKYSDKINEFVAKLTDLDHCGLCKELYDLQLRLPRILIHCGHTICSSCLGLFIRKGKVRCPMCLKLIRNLSHIQILPLNHTVFKKLVDKFNSESKESVNADQQLFRQFDISQKMRAQNTKIDKQSGLSYCAVHPDRVQHFFCQFHKVLACRVCSEAGHTKKECKIVDLYQVQNPQMYLDQEQMLLDGECSDQLCDSSQVN